MRERLCSLEVTKANAHRIWGPATFVFLGVLHVSRAIRRRPALRESVPSTSSLARSWLAMLLAERDQGDDYASTAASVYDGRFFPSLAWDLSSRFNEAPHPEILAIISVAYAHVWAGSHVESRPALPIMQ